MAEKTYVADVAFESIRKGRVIVTEETQRITSLLGAGYIHEVSGDVYATDNVPGDDWVDDSDESELLERFEDLDEVEVVTEKPKRGRKPQER